VSQGRAGESDTAPAVETRMAPDAVAAAASSRAGVTTLATPKRTPHGVVGPTAAAPWARKAKAAPRSTIPMMAMLNGT